MDIEQRLVEHCTTVITTKFDVETALQAIPERMREGLDSLSPTMLNSLAMLAIQVPHLRAFQRRLINAVDWRLRDANTQSPTLKEEDVVGILDMVWHIQHNVPLVNPVVPLDHPLLGGTETARGTVDGIANSTPNSPTVAPARSIANSTPNSPTVSARRPYGWVKERNMEQNWRSGVSRDDTSKDSTSKDNTSKDVTSKEDTPMDNTSWSNISKDIPSKDDTPMDNTSKDNIFKDKPLFEPPPLRKSARQLSLEKKSGTVDQHWSDFQGPGSLLEKPHIKSRNPNIIQDPIGMSDPHINFQTYPLEVPVPDSTGKGTLRGQYIELQDADEVREYITNVERRRAEHQRAQNPVSQETREQRRRAAAEVRRFEEIARQREERTRQYQELTEANEEMNKLRWERIARRKNDGENGNGNGNGAGAGAGAGAAGLASRNRSARRG